ncbi:hypothetical protein EVC11_041 [Rhizobium phage RHph_I20]|uniref:Uncharacterized protein n=1 Tax=Rhizobium phage RHph_I20 TaxID=2509730 RepID=A0A7S5RBT6_9CAUD|nr:hypothetical protein EVC11_041 [Rhizobium phage RHph_I20]
MTRFLFKWVATKEELIEKFERLRKAYDALDAYCAHLIDRVHQLEGANRKLREDAQCKSNSPAKE